MTVSPAAGTSTDGVANVSLTPSTRDLRRTTYRATLAVTINGAAAMSVPATLEVRNPILTIRHSGQGGGYVWVEYDDDPNDVMNEYTNVELVNTPAGVFESSISIPEGRSAFIRAYTEGDCSLLQGLFDESGARINDPNWFYYEPNAPCFGCAVHPMLVRMDGDREITADFSLSGLACTACGFVSLPLCFAGLRRTRPIRG